MCRILVFAGKHVQENEEIFINYLKTHVKASENDPFLNKITSGKKKSHGDGWGLTGIGYCEKNIPAILIYKTILPIYHDLSREVLELFINRMKKYGELYLILHSRVGSKKEPYGEKYTHPFEIIGDEYVLWFIHNGDVDKKELALELGINPWLYTDSWIAAIYVSRRIKQCVSSEKDLDNCVYEAYNSLSKYIVSRSALNTGLLILYNNNPYLYSSYILGEEAREHEELVKYYQLYSCKNNEFNTIVSSTTAYYLGQDCIEIDQGVYKLSFEKLEKIL